MSNKQNNSDDHLSNTQLHLTALDKAPVGIFSASVDGFVQSTNNTLAVMLGYESKDELHADISSRLWELFSDPACKDTIEDCLTAQGKVENLECSLKSRYDTILWADVNAHLIRDDKGIPRTIHGYVNDITGSKEIESLLHEKNHALGERVKELQVIYQISRAFEKDMPLDEIFHVAVQAISAGWQNPAVTCVRIVYDQLDVRTDNYQETPWQISETVTVRDGDKCRIVVGYLKKMPKADQGLFLREEIDLLKAVAVHLGLAVERKASMDELVAARDRIKQSENLWRTVLSEVSDTVILTDERGDISFVCPNVHFIFGYNRAETFAMENISNLLPDLEYDSGELEKCGYISNLHCTLTDKFGNQHDGLVGVKKVDIQGHKLMFTVHEATKLMEKNRQLAEANRLLDMFFSDTPDLMLIIDPDGRIIRINNAWNSILGYSPEDLKGSSIESLIHPDDISWSFAARKRICSGEDISKVVNRFKARSGEYRSIEWRSTLSGKVLYAVGRDVTEQKAQEYELFRQSELQRLLMQSAIGLINLPFSEIDSAVAKLLGGIGRFTGADRVCLFRYDFEKMTASAVHQWNNKNIDPLGSLVRDISTPPFDKWARQHEKGETVKVLPGDEDVKQCSETGCGSLLAIPMMYKDTCMGFVCAQSLTRDIVWPEIDEFLLKVCSELLTNVNVRFEADQAFQRERAQLLSVFDSITEVIYVSDPDTYEILYVNEFLKKQFSKELVGGICYHELQGRTSPCEFCTNYIIKNKNGRAHRWEHYNAELGRHFYVTDKLIKWPDGRDVRFELAIDITRRKQAEESLSRVNKQLEMANAEKDKFFSIIGHDLKSPISGIFSSTQILASDIEILSNDDIRLISEEIYKGIKNVLALLDDILQWSRMSQGLMDYTPEPCDLSDLTMASLNTAKDVAVKKNISITCEVPSNLCVLVDQPMINTVIRNVIFNAVKFTPQGGNISVTARNTGAEVEVCVQDDGIGMNEVIISQIFTLAKSKRQYGTDGEKGTGLGLVLCKEFVEKHGGIIWAESEPGKGTKVFFTLSAAS